VDPVSVWPACAVPLIAGRELTAGETAVESGAGGGGAIVADATSGVAADVAAVDPFRFDAVTITRSVCPTSADESVFAEVVAPPIAAQPAPAESHRSHWYAYFRVLPCQVPVLAERMLGTCASPLIDGGVWFLGGCWPSAREPPEATAVARTTVRAAAVAAVMRRLITSLHSGATEWPVTLERGIRPVVPLSLHGAIRVSSTTELR
jgi:hypothetical protein